MIILIGLPGSGKSTVGRQLARRLSASFVDSDQLIEQRLGCSIREYFEREGEAAFRDVEAAVLEAALSGRTESGDGAGAGAISVLATGGGAVLREGNRQLLRAAGNVVYLRSSPDDLLKRLRHDRRRPLLQGVDPMLKLRDLYAVRDPLYRETAHVHIDTGRPNVATLVNAIMLQLGLTATPAAPALAPVPRSIPNSI